jgi:hypothetical protein
VVDTPDVGPPCGGLEGWAMDPDVIIRDAVVRSATAAIAASGQHLVTQLLATSAEVELVAPTGHGAGRDVEHVAERLRSGEPLTALASSEAADGLGDLRARPGSVKDLLAVRATDGWSVGRELDRLCAGEAARRAPAIAMQLAHEHEGLAAALLAAHRLAGCDGAIDPQHALVAAVAAGLAMELLARITDTLGDVPLGEASPALRH